ncbi:integral membrane [Lecanosticta acicola]|uniref:Integral membrane n=1 Tax=Lecanosticta acicola TaxID=111012 RepID=A0AAI9E9J0_9PEZI|nr:integral membrane [Lecanosticta acicola]
MFGRKKKTEEGEGAARSGSDRTLTNENEPSKAQIKRATRTRLCWALLTSLFLLISVVFLILVEVGDTRVGKIRSAIYFIKLDLSDIIPVSVPNAVLINSIAQSLGLHDFYTVGLWNYCEGYDGQGTTACSPTQTLYWFNPIEIIQSELLAGATIALPAELNNILDLIRLVSHWMFGLFLAAACVNFLLIFIVPLSIYSRWATFPIAIFTFLGALFVTVAAVIATVMFIIMKDAITSATQLNIGAELGVEMFAFMWIAASSAILAWLIQMGMCCCCASRRDVRTGRKRGSKRAWGTETPGVSEKPAKKKKGLPAFGRTKREK